MRAAEKNLSLHGTRFTANQDHLSLARALFFCVPEKQHFSFLSATSSCVRWQSCELSDNEAQTTRGLKTVVNRDLLAYCVKAAFPIPPRPAKLPSSSFPRFSHPPTRSENFLKELFAPSKKPVDAPIFYARPRLIFR